MKDLQNLKKPVQIISIVIAVFVLNSLFQNCENAFQAESSSQDDVAFQSENTDLGINPAALSSSFEEELCHLWVVGNDANGVPTWGPSRGVCQKDQNPFLFSITHENECNTHMACGGYPSDANFRENIKAYMADYDPKDLGTWYNYSALGNRNYNLISSSLDTINFANYKSPTGRPVSDGYLFFGLADLSLNTNVTINDDLWVEFEYRIIGAELGNHTKSGHRLILGANLIWEEVGRSNTSHFLEINLFKNADYHSAHFDSKQCTKDAIYDHCFYDPLGRYAEGKYLSGQEALGIESHGADSQWRKVKINLFSIVRSYSWFHKPVSWERAKLGGVYWGIETKDKARIFVEIKNLNTSSVNRIIASPTVPVEPPSTALPTQPSVPARPQPPVINSEPPVFFNAKSNPVGLFRDGIRGFNSDGVSYCSFSDSKSMMNSGYLQADYDEARQIPESSVVLKNVGACHLSSLTTRFGLFRQGVSGLVKYLNNNCILQSTEHLVKCGFRQQDYNTAKQVNLGDLSRYESCNCG